MTDAQDHEPWHARWRDGRIGFHQPNGNPLLKAHLPALNLAPGARIFLPLCGKTGDIAWLLAEGFQVCGIELSRIAIEQLFDELNAVPEITDHGPLSQFSAPGLDIIVGDIFELTAHLLGPVDAVYDRAALVALPENLRGRYAEAVAQAVRHAPQLLLTFHYAPEGVSGPPFPVLGGEIETHYSGYTLTLLASTPVQGGLKDGRPAHELTWHLS